MTLPPDKYLIEALAVFNLEAASVDTIKSHRGYYTSLIAHARALERIAELEAVEAGLSFTADTLHRERDEALAKLAQYEPRVDPDLALAREVAAEIMPYNADAYRSGRFDHNTYVQCALAGIKAGRAGGGL